MSHGKKSKRKKHKHLTNHERAEGDAKLNHKPDHVNVSGKIEADLPPKLIDKYDAAGQKQERWDRKKFIAEIVTIILILIYTGVAGWQGFLIRQQVALSQRTFDASNRPYVGVNDFQIGHLWIDSSGIQQHSAVRVVGKTTMLALRIEIKNFGPVPGTKFQDSIRMFVDGVEQPTSPKVPDLPSTLFPGQTIYLTSFIGTRDYPSVISGEKTLVIEVTVEYQGPSSYYKECEKEQYSPIVNTFFKLGPGCTK